MFTAGMHRSGGDGGRHPTHTDTHRPGSAALTQPDTVPCCWSADRRLCVPFTGVCCRTERTVWTERRVNDRSYLPIQERDWAPVKSPVWRR